MVLILLMVATVALLVSLAGFCYLKKKGERIGERSLKEDSWDVKSFHVLTFTEDEILDSIKQENLIGKGGSGNVYRVAVGNHKELAVKHIWHSDDYGGRKKMGSSTPILARRGTKSREFEAEVQTLSSIRHINVVKLYCSISSEDSSLLVYEYMSNGSLWDRLHCCKKLSLDWETRYEVALGAAKGLEYLHHGCDRPVIHRDVKSSNILLDEDLKPRIADFGLAKIVQANSSKESTQIIAGTHGYIAPEYAYTNKVNEKSDVYSFGVVLMELVTGKRPIEPEFGENKDIVDWVCGKLKTKESVVSLVDSAIHEVHRENAIKVLKVAILCTARLPTLRPTMRTVVQMLEEAQPWHLVSIVVSKDGGGKKDQELMENHKL
ncbi:UNVERIFIED_CONTAM: Receptor-like protein kinase [Sesamum angustifolium]|uniref:non-specific serine/threonine protein kinase n=1 Tax=Sesamum angustifolium TaxID=2727405 RepID=A0AAW2LUR6_9LAMI